MVGNSIRAELERELELARWESLRREIQNRFDRLEGRLDRIEQEIETLANEARRKSV
jgi:hypothetical protein